MEQVYSARAQSLRLQPLYCQRRPTLERIFSRLGLQPNATNGNASRNPGQAGALAADAGTVAEYEPVRPSSRSRVRQYSVSSSVSSDTVASFDHAPGSGPAADNVADWEDADSFSSPLCRGLSVTPPASSVPSPARLSEWSEEDVGAHDCSGTGSEDSIRFISTKRTSRPRRRRNHKDKTKEVEVIVPALRITRLAPPGEPDTTRDLSFTDNCPVGLTQQLPALLKRRSL